MKLRFRLTIYLTIWFHQFLASQLVINYYMEYLLHDCTFGSIPIGVGYSR